MGDCPPTNHENRCSCAADDMNLFSEQRQLRGDSVSPLNCVSKRIVDKYIYLNNAATSFPKPEQVLQAVEVALRKPPFHHARTGFEQELANVVFECRKQLAALFNVPDPDRIVFSSGATESLNLVVNGLPLDGRHVVTTAIEHNSVLRPLKTMERDGRISLSIVGCDKRGLVTAEGIESALRPETGAVIVNHCSNVTGVVTDIKAIGDITKQCSVPFVVDVSQSAGVYQIDVQQMNIDILAFTGHKALYGIPGIGGAYIREGIDLKPLKVGGTGVRSDYLFQPETVPMFYEAGTQNIPGIISLYEGVKHIREKEIDNIRKCKEELVRQMRQHMLQSGDAITYPDKACSQVTTIFSFNIKGMDPADVEYILNNSFGIVIRSGLHCAPLIHKHISTFPDGCVRVSPSCFTTGDEINAFNNAVEQILKMVK